MIFNPTSLAGAFVVDLEQREDHRGFFARTWCQREFETHGLNGRLAQCSISFNYERGTLRGMHWQAPPFGEAKLVRCTRGAIHDVIIDLRGGSPTFTKSFSVILSYQNRRMLYVPPGLAHGFQTLEGDTEVTYQISEFYRPECARGVRWNDPAFAIEWPRTGNRVMSLRDQTYPDFMAGLKEPNVFAR